MGTPPPPPGAPTPSGSGTPPSAPAVARRLGLDARRALTGPQRAHASRLIVDGVLGLPELRSGPAGIVASYRALDDEVDLATATATLRFRGWSVALPRILEGPAMEFVRWEPDADLVRNRHGIEEPSPPVEQVAPDVVLVPCVAVDADLHRVGFGAGYYDRTLAERPDALRIGVCFEVQVVEGIAAEDWDVPLHLVVTEERTIRPSV